MKKVVISGMLGNGLEWYDFALYGQMAVLIGHLFFPPGDEAAGLLAAFSLFAVGFLFRPLGAILFGWIGDRYGRRLSLMIAILTMAIPTGCIGLLPTYEQIGLWAPALLTLIRALQGLSLGGEFSGSITYIVEHAPPHRRGLAGAASLMSLVLGFMLGSAVALLTVNLLSPEDFQSWGWRIPFLGGIGIGLIGLYIRSHCDESPAYEAAKAEGSLSPQPLRDAFKQHPRAMLQGFGAYLTVTMPFYLTSIYLISFTQKYLGRTPHEALTANFAVMSVMLIGIFGGAFVSDRVGRKPVMITMAAILFLTVGPIFYGMDHAENFAGLLAAQLSLALIVGGYLGPVASFLVELFPTSVRSTGMAIAYNLAAAVFGGTAPVVCEWLMRQTGTPLSIAAYVMLCCVISLLTLTTCRERFREKLAV